MSKKEYSLGEPTTPGDTNMSKAKYWWFYPSLLEPTTPEDTNNYVLNCLFYIVVLSLAVLIPTFTTYKDDDAKQAFYIVGYIMCVAIAVGIFSTLLTFNFYRAGIRLGNMPTKLLILFGLLIISGSVLYSLSEKPDSLDGTRPAGLTLLFVAIFVFILWLNSWRMNPIIRRLLIGVIVILALATPLHILGKEVKVINNLSMVLYGIGVSIMLSAVMVSIQMSRAHKCKNRYIRATWGKRGPSGVPPVSTDSYDIDKLIGGTFFDIDAEI